MRELILAAAAGARTPGSVARGLRVVGFRIRRVIGIVVGRFEIRILARDDVDDFGVERGDDLGDAAFIGRELLG